jgi:hypothetical protein
MEGRIADAICQQRAVVLDAHEKEGRLAATGSDPIAPPATAEGE